MIETIHSSEDWLDLQHSTKHPIVVQFTATWCGPCKRITPFVEKFASDPSFGSFVFCKIDIDEAESQLWEWAMVPSVPTFRIVVGGKTVSEFSDSNPDKLYKTLLQFV